MKIKQNEALFESSNKGCCNKLEEFKRQLTNVIL